MEKKKEKVMKNETPKEIPERTKSKGPGIDKAGNCKACGNKAKILTEHVACLCGVFAK